jgi:hypothetical protein
MTTGCVLADVMLGLYDEVLPMLLVGGFPLVVLSVPGTQKRPVV